MIVKETSSEQIKTKWMIKSLRQLATINYGKSPAAILAEDGPYPVVGTGGTERYGDAYLYDGDSIIVGRKGTIDRVQFVSNKFWAIDTAYYLSDFVEAVPKWLYYFFLTLNLRQMNEATGVPSLSRELLYKVKVPTPPEPEQVKIAEILTIVDKAIEQTEALIAKQQRIKTGLMQDLLTRGIDEHGNLRREKTHKFKDSRLGRIPKEWDVKPLRKLLESINQGWSPDCESDQAARDEWGVLKTTAVVWEGFKDSENKALPYNMKPRTQLEIRAGDLLMTRAGPNSRVGVVSYVYSTRSKLILSDKIYRLVPNTDADGRFLCYSLSSFQSQRHLSTLKTGMAESQTNISQEIVRSMLSVCPSLLEQRRIADRLDGLNGHLSNYLDLFQKLVVLKTGLMQDLLTGKKRVTSLLKVGVAQCQSV